MALTKDKKNQVVDDVSQLLASSRLTVVTAYQGTSVQALQQLRREAKVTGTTLKVIKNRLVTKALQNSETFKDTDTSALTGMLLYAFNDQDEVAPAQAIANFAKKQPSLQFVGAITSDGQFLPASDVTALAQLPTKPQLQALLVGTLAAPLSGFVNVLAGNVRGVLNVLQARADNLPS